MKRIILLIIIVAMLATMAGATPETEAISHINNLIDDAGAEWTAGATTVSGLTPVEQNRLALGDTIPEPRGTKMKMPLTALSHEPKFDLRDIGMVTAVRNQGYCGSCWAFSAVGAVESAFLMHTGKAFDLSEQHLVSECCNAGSCDGGWPDWSLDYIKTKGIPDEACYPYQATDEGCDPCDGWEAGAHVITGHEYVSPSKDAFKTALKMYGAIAVVVTVPDDWYYYRSGVYSPISDVGWANHAVLLTGWDDSDGCWFIKNSWGAGWGEQGYARVKYGDLEKYNYAYAVTGVEEHGAAPDPDGWLTPVSASASTEHSDKYSAASAIDDDDRTYWFSDVHDDAPEIVFDVGSVEVIDAVRAMIHERHVPITLAIDVSIDGDHWRTVVESAQVTDPDAFTEIEFGVERCQYVRVRTLHSFRGYGTLTEFEVRTAQDTPDSRFVIEIQYPDRSESFIISPDMQSMTVLCDGSRVFAWWVPGSV